MEATPRSQVLAMAQPDPPARKPPHSETRPGLQPGAPLQACTPVPLGPHPGITAEARSRPDTNLSLGTQLARLARGQTPGTARVGVLITPTAQLVPADPGELALRVIYGPLLVLS